MNKTPAHMPDEKPLSAEEIAALDEFRSHFEGHISVLQTDRMFSTIRSLTADKERLEQRIQAAPHEEGGCAVSIWQRQCEESTRFSVWNPNAPACNCWKADAKTISLEDLCPLHDLGREFSSCTCPEDHPNRQKAHQSGEVIISKVLLKADAKEGK